MSSAATATLPSPPLGAPGAATAPPRNIIICLDGTGNQFSARNSNVVKLMSVLRVDESQSVFYSSGLGTILPDSAPSWSWVQNTGAKLMDEGLALNFDKFVCDAYQYLMDYYRAGDKIYLFGFSRGAYTARALAGMIQKVGLLAPGNHNQIKLAYEVYSDTKKYAEEFKDIAPYKNHEHEHPRDPAIAYRRIFGISRTVTIEFMGVWDTVSSLSGYGIPSLPFADGVTSVKVFRHALALDERRAKFSPEYRKVDDKEDDLLENVANARAAVLQGKPGAGEQLQAAKAKLDAKYPLKVQVEREQDKGFPVTGKEAKAEVVKSKEVWFMGCHSDCGGGNELNDRKQLANVSFRWMLREAVACGLNLDPNGVALEPSLAIPKDELAIRGIDQLAVEVLAKLKELLEEADCARCAAGHADNATGVKGVPTLPDEAKHAAKVFELWALLNQRTLAKVVDLAARLDTDAPFQGKDAKGQPAIKMNDDVMSKLHESLRAKWFLLEHIPFISRSHTSKGTDVEGLRANHGDSRQMWPSQTIHRSVLRRLEAEQLAKVGKDEAYMPAAKPAEFWPAWAALKAGTAKLPADFVGEFIEE